MDKDALCASIEKCKVTVKGIDKQTDSFTSKLHLQWNLISYLREKRYQNRKPFSGVIGFNQ